MDTPLTVEEPSENQPAPPRRSRFVGCALILCGLFGVGILALVGIWLYRSHLAAEELAVQVAKVRARGEPLTTVELNDYYQPAKNRPDMTHDIVTALTMCHAPELTPLAAALPFVGTGAEVPKAPAAWPQLEEAEAYLARQTAALDIFRDIRQREGTARLPIDLSLGFGTVLSETQRMRTCARLLSLQYQVHLHRGRPREAVECILDQIALARLLEQEPVLISQLVRIALVSVAVENLQEVVRMTHVADADLLRLQRELRKLEFQSCLIRALAGERTFGYLVCSEPLWHAEGTPAITPAAAREIAQRPPKRVRDAAKSLELNLRLAEAADQSLFAALCEGQQVDAEILRLRGGTFSRLEYMMTLLSSPATGTAVTAFARGAAKRDAADVAIAAELYRRQLGAWPERLDQLVPEYLPAVPVDAFSNQPLKMISTPAEFTVYSVGKDGQDDGGKLSTRDDLNTDVGFEMPVRTGE